MQCQLLIWKQAATVTQYLRPSKKGQILLIHLTLLSQWPCHVLKTLAAYPKTPHHVKSAESPCHLDPTEVDWKATCRQRPSVHLSRACLVGKRRHKVRAAQVWTDVPRQNEWKSGEKLILWRRVAGQSSTFSSCLNTHRPTPSTPNPTASAHKR